MSAIQKIERHQDEILLWDQVGNAPLILSHDEAVDISKRLLDLVGQMKQEQDEEMLSLI